jgi:DNA-binding LacI/PurR family transcriptional regulator
MGREMARLLLDRIRGDNGAGSVILDTHLVRRASA